MSDSVLRTTAAHPSASELSENIGDVLASIRRLIAEDDAADMGNAIPGEAACADAANHPGPVSGVTATPNNAPAENHGHSQRPRSEATAARRRAILAEAQALSEQPVMAPAAEWPLAHHADPEGAGGEQTGQSPSTANVLPLSPEERVALPHAGSAAGSVEPLLLRGPSVEASRAAAALSTASSPIAAEKALPDREQPADKISHVDCIDTATDDASSLVHAPIPDPDASASLPDFKLSGASADHTADCSNPSHPLSPETAMTMSSTAQSRPIATGQHTTPNDALPGDRTAADDNADSLLATMIRAVVRSELQTAGMSRDLRAMILREVAQVLTGGARSGGAA